MGLTSTSSGFNVLRENFNLDINNNNKIVALAGNPNTGKSTVFNGLTGLKQHTGNWPGKTVTQARGYYEYRGQGYTLVDLPGTYSLLANSTEERIARDFICFAKPDVTIVLVDATNLERNLNLVLQVIELTEKTIVCLNLMDEAKRKGIEIDIKGLSNDLGIPVVPTIARDKKGLRELKHMVYKVVTCDVLIKPYKIKYPDKIEEASNKIVQRLKKIFVGLEDELNLQWLALRLLEGDTEIVKYFNKFILNKLYFNNLSREW